MFNVKPILVCFNNTSSLRLEAVEKYRVKVHKKGLIIIPAEVRRRLGIHEGSQLELVVEGSNSIRLIVPESLRNAFGVDGDKALEVIRLIKSSRRAKVEAERLS